MITLYIETNFLIGFAKNQDQEAQSLVERIQNQNLDQTATDSIQIVIPSICCMEAFSVLEDERERRKSFNNRLERDIKELKKNIDSEHSQSLRKHLQEANLSNEKMDKEIRERLFQILNWVASYVELIALTSSILQEGLDKIFIDDQTDNLILHCILCHSKTSSENTKVFLSNNSKDFGSKEIKQILADAGVSKYLTKTKEFWGWVSSVASSD